MNLEELRAGIDEVDARLIRDVEERMDIAAKISAWKKENGMPTLDPKREREKLASICTNCREDLQSYYRVLYSLLFELSRC